MIRAYRTFVFENFFFLNITLIEEFKFLLYYNFKNMMKPVYSDFTRLKKYYSDLEIDIHAK